MSKSVKILPSDKNDLIFVSELENNGRFSVRIPYTDANRRKRRLTVKRLNTLQPFIPSNVSSLFDSSSVSQSIINPDKYYVVDFDVEKLSDTYIFRNFKELQTDRDWKVYSKVKDLYDRGGEKTGIFLRNDYFSKVMSDLYNNYSFDSNNFDFSKYVQVFVEIGNKLDESQITSLESNTSLRMDEMKMYLFPLSFYYPTITQSSSSSGTELDVGSSPTLSYDDVLRSMLRFVLLDINKGDLRSVLTQSKRSLYLEYDVQDPSAPEKTITKYVWAFSLGNPILFNVSTGEDPNYFTYVHQTGNSQKYSAYGRAGTFANLSALDSANVEGRLVKLYLKDYLADIGYALDPVSKYDSQKDNCLLTPLRPNFGSVIIGSLLMSLLNDELPDMKTVFGEFENNVESYRKYFPSENSILDLFTGQISGSGSISLLSNIRNVSLFNKANFVNSFYGNDYLLKLVCEQTETSVVDSKKRQKTEKILAFITPSDTTYQQFLGSDNQISIQPPTFRPLVLLSQEQSLILRNSNNVLDFKILNIADEPVSFVPGDKIIIVLNIEAES